MVNSGSGHTVGQPFLSFTCWDAVFKMVNFQQSESCFLGFRHKIHITNKECFFLIKVPANNCPPVIQTMANSFLCKCIWGLHLDHFTCISEPNHGRQQETFRVNNFYILFWNAWMNTYIHECNFTFTNILCDLPNKVVF